MPTPRLPVTDRYHGIEVHDDYRWLEEPGKTEVREWTAAQNAHTRARLDALPIREKLAAQLESLYADSSANYSSLEYREGIHFLLYFKPPAQQPVLIALRSLQKTSDAITILDPNKFDPSGSTAIDWFVPSPDGKQVAVCLSQHGSEDGTLHFFETQTGRKLADEIPRTQYPTAGGSAAWTADGTGIFYTRYPAPGERAKADIHFYQQVWFHKLGTPAADDTYAIGRDFPRIAEVDLRASEDGHHVIATVADGDGGDYAHWLRADDGAWQQITKFEDAVKRVVFGRDGTLYALSRKNAPRGKVLRMTLATPNLSEAAITVPQGANVMEGIVAAPGGFFLKELAGGPSQIRWFPAGKEPVTVPLPALSAVQEMEVLHGDQLAFKSNGWLTPASFQTYDPQSEKLERLPISSTSPVSFDDIEVTRVMAKSKDGTEVPLNIMHRKGVKLDGMNPTLLYAYGGYGISMSPSFDFTRRVWFDAGGIFVVANLRGGGEFGEEWHKAGNLTRKQNVFDDFIACAEHLVRAGYTQPAKLAIMGGSNGGLLMGAALTQRPELFRAVVTMVGIYDMLRVELEPNGAFNITEFGTVKDRAQFNALHAYSPYHRVKDGTAYPAVLITTGENDGRVNPYNSRKMTARLQAATSSERPVMLRTSAASGHGMGSKLSERISEKADIYTFLITELGARVSQWLPSAVPSLEN
ncbi:MAG: prolyl oligopeptidase family serine peptidase [Chthoniobacteraceae bacterium]